MCEYEILTSRYRSCKLQQYASYGRTVESHTFTSKYIHQCKDPKPDRESGKSYCDERLQTERVKVTEAADRGYTKVVGECPACKAAEEKCFEVFIIPNQNAAIKDSDAIEPTVPQTVVEHPLQQNRVAEQGRAVEVVTSHVSDSKKKSHPRPTASANRQQPSHGRQNDDGCCNIL